MKRAVILGGILAVALAAVFLLNDKAATVSLTDAKAVRAGEGTMFMVGLEIQSAGAPDKLLSVSSPAADMVSIMNPGHPEAVLTVPADGSGILAMDGAHIMLRAKPGEFLEGAFLPLILTFEKAGEISTRVLNAGTAEMDHGQANGVHETPVPELALRWKKEPDEDGLEVQLDVRNFKFVRVGDDAAHVPNEGHAHIYLNGLKLGRMYQDTFAVGRIPPGRYTLTVSLNTHDHRPYLNGDGVVSKSRQFLIAE